MIWLTLTKKEKQSVLKQLFDKMTIVELFFIISIVVLSLVFHYELRKDCNQKICPEGYRPKYISGEFTCICFIEPR